MWKTKCHEIWQDVKPYDKRVMYHKRVAFEESCDGSTMHELIKIFTTIYAFFFFMGTGCLDQKASDKLKLLHKLY